jgi:hypothetical protein
MYMAMTKRHSGTREMTKQSPRRNTSKPRTLNRAGLSAVRAWTVRGKGAGLSAVCSELSAGPTKKTEDEKQFCPRRCSSSGLSAGKISENTQWKTVLVWTVHNSGGLSDPVLKRNSTGTELGCS